MPFKEFRYLILADLYRLYGKANLKLLLFNVLFGEAFKYIFWLRTCRYARNNPLLKYNLYPLTLLMLHHYKYKFGIAISIKNEIGPGLYIGHFGGIIVYPLCKIGKNCNLSQGVTLGKTNRGKSKGYPTIGDNVYIGPGAKVIGAVKVGNNVAIGANCVVTKDVPDNAVVVGIPGGVISYDSSEGYVCHTDYDGKIC
jgi:serine O-acetyltransferase